MDTSRRIINRKRTSEEVDDEDGEGDAALEENISLRRRLMKRPRLTFNPLKILKFRSSIQGIKAVWEESDHERQKTLYFSTNEAIKNYAANFKTCGFKENLKKTCQFLKSHNIVVSNDNSQSSDSTIISTSKQVTDILNRNSYNSFNVSSLRRNHYGRITPTALLLLQTICEVCYCGFVVFSSRSCPVLIKPYLQSFESRINIENRVPMPLFTILHHKDSICPQNSYWIPLKLCALPKSPESINVPRQLLNSLPDDQCLKATRRVEGEKRSRAKKTNSEDIFPDEVILRHITDKVNSAYFSQWKSLKPEQQTEGAVPEFLDSLRKKYRSLPQGVFTAVQTTLERSVEDKSQIPVGKTWLSARWNKLKRKNNYDLEYFYSQFNIFILEHLVFTRNNPESSSSRSIDHDDDSDIEFEELETISKEVEESTDVEYRTFTVTLKKVLSSSIDYDFFLSILEKEQKIIHDIISSMRHVLQILSESILDGSLCSYFGFTESSNEVFNYKSLDIDIDGEEHISVVPEAFREKMVSDNIFSLSSFYNIMSSCVGDKKKDSKKSELIIFLKEKMDEGKRVDFKVSDLTNSALQKIHTSFKNMWNLDSFKKDLKTVITTVLRINFAKKRFKRSDKDKDYQLDSSKEIKEMKPKSQKNNRKRYLKRLESEVIKRSKGKANILEHLVEVIFGLNDETIQPSFDKITLDHGDEGQLEVEEVLDDPVYEDIVGDDLDGGSIRALTAAMMMLVQSDKINQEITPEYFKKQLYLDKQDMPDNIYSTCANIINTSRPIALKKGENPAIFNCIRMKKLRNVIVKHANNSGYRISSKQQSLFSAQRDDEKELESFHVTSRGLYTLVCNYYHTYSDEGNSPHNEFTSITSIKSKEKAFFRNFFNIKYLMKRFKKQKLEPAWSFDFSNLYNISFLGKRSVINRNVVSKHSISDREKGDVATSEQVADTKRLADELKAERDHLKILQSNLKTLENTRFETALQFRRKEKVGIWDDEAYQELKGARREFNLVYQEVSRLENVIKKKNIELYDLNKIVYNRRRKDIEFTEDIKDMMIINRELLKSSLEKKNASINGLDPGLNSTATMNCTPLKVSVNSINRFHALENLKNPEEIEANDYHATKLNITPGFLRNVTFSNTHRRKREEQRKNEIAIKSKQMQQNRLTRKMRLKLAHQKLISDNRKSMKSRIVFNFVGNWNGNATGIKGISRSSLKPILSQLKTDERDTTTVVDEYGSTITCMSCFKKLRLHVYRRDSKLKRIKGALTCFNLNCPSRINRRATVVNRDNNGATNIALIGFSSLVSTNGNPLPPFNKSKESRFDLANEFKQFFLPERKDKLPA